MSQEQLRSAQASESLVWARMLTVNDLGQQHRDVFTRPLFNVLQYPLLNM